jgi:hypothetical protein
MAVGSIGPWIYLSRVWFVYCTKVLRVQLEWEISTLARHTDNVNWYVSNYHRPTLSLQLSFECVPWPWIVHVKSYYA